MSDDNEKPRPEEKRVARAPRFSRDADSVAFVATLVLHGLILTAILVLPQPPRREARVGTRQISRSQFAKNRSLQRSKPLDAQQLARREELKERLKQERDEREKQKIEKQIKDLNGQIVDLPRSPDDKVPENAKYLSEFNTNTKRETKSKHRTSDYKRAANEVTGQKSDVKVAEDAALESPGVAAKGTGKPAKKAQAAKQQQVEIPRVDKRDRLALSIDNSLGVFKNHQSSEQTQGNSDRFHVEPGAEAQPEEGGGEKGQQGSPTIKQLMPNMGTLARIAGAPANDHLPEDIADGEGTFLNSREFKFAPFFNRLKQTVSQHWKPLDEFRRRDPTGNIYGFQNRYTLLTVTLAANGDLKSVEVLRSSGVDFLDREAVLAFQRASPFPNPPKQLIKDGNIEFAFGFHIEFGSGMGINF